MDEYSTKLFFAFRRMGLSEAQAAIAAGGRENRSINKEDFEQPLSEAEKAIESALLTIGLSPAEARTGAVGRGELVELAEPNHMTDNGELTDEEVERLLKIAEMKVKLFGKSTSKSKTKATKKKSNEVNLTEGDSHEIDLYEYSSQAGVNRLREI